MVHPSNMGDDTYIHSLHLSCLPLKTREMLSYMLDAPKIILSDGPEKLPRDWRGLAYLVNVSSEKAAYIQLLPHKTMEVLQIWQKERNATVGQLLQYLERLDRFDVYDDLCSDLKELLRKRELTENRQNQLAININNNNNNNSQQEVFEPITYDDRPGYEHHYDGFVLYAKEDQRFVDELMDRMRAEGFELCTEDKLQAGHMTPYAPVTQLILKRCQRIILVCSPEFVSSQVNTFYRDYAQAVSIESHNNHKIIPIMYRECQLPSHLAFYHKLYYNENEERAMYDFWFKLKQSLQGGRSLRQPCLNRLNGTTAPPAVQPQIKIVELPPSNLVHDYLTDDLFLPPTHLSTSMSALDSLTVKTVSSDCNSLSNFSQKSSSSAEKKKKSSRFTHAMLKIFRIKNDKVPKSKKAIMIAH